MHFTSILALGAIGLSGVLGDGGSGAAQTLPIGASPTLGDGDYSYGGAPEPTTAPYNPFGELAKRQSMSNLQSVCGVLTTSVWSYTCTGGWVCGVNSQDRSNFGCCSQNLGGGSVSGCYFPTACYDYSVAKTMSCGVGSLDCTWSSLYCSSSTRPYCGKFIQGTLTALGCFVSPSLTYQLAPYTGQSITATAASDSRTSVSSASRSQVAGSSSSTAAPINSVPFTQQQQSVGGSQSSTQAAATSRNLAPGIASAGEHIYVFVMSFVLLLM